MHMLESHPFWGYLLLQVRLVPAPELPAIAATDALRYIWFNPAFTAQLPDKELGFVIVHELVHQLFAWENRRGDREPARWNQATDYVVNRVVAGIIDPASRHYEPLYTPPNRAIDGLGVVQTLLDSRYDRLLAEGIYDRLPADVTFKRYEKVGIPVAADADGEGTEFRGVVDHNAGFDLHIQVPLSNDDREMMSDRFAEAMEHWDASSRQGHLPSDLLRGLGVLEPPQVPWQRVLHRFFDEALSKSEYSRTRPNKRYLDSDIIVPGLIGDEIEHIVVALDVSGSMSRADITLALSEIRALAAHTVELTCIVADAEVQAVLKGDEIDDAIQANRFRGGGGTSHIPVFEYIESERLHPTVFVGLTDLVSSFPDVAPPYPVLWVVSNKKAKAPWGRVVVIN